ncbi:MAG: hypothetical protein JEZ04_10980 [Spirochaetales bacterium]|nr:hypothetical protein [Spirochaetales bacterium]
MRKSFLLPLKFLVFFIISAAVFCLFSLIFHWGQNFSTAGESNRLLIFLAPTAGNVVLPSVSSALLFTVFDYRKKSIGLVGVLLLTVSVFAVLFFGFRLTASLEDPDNSTNYHPFENGKIHSVNGTLVYTETAGMDSSGKIEGIVIREPGASLPGFRYYEAGRFLKSPEPHLTSEGMKPVSVIPQNPVYNHVFRAPDLFSGYMGDMSFSNLVFIEASRESGINFVLLTAAITAFLMVCLLFKGVTVWPLFEMILILFFHRIIFYLIRLFSSEADFISESFFGGKTVADIPFITISALAVVLLLSGLLLRTSNRLRKK